MSVVPPGFICPGYCNSMCQYKSVGCRVKEHRVGTVCTKLHATKSFNANKLRKIEQQNQKHLEQIRKADLEEAEHTANELEYYHPGKGKQLIEAIVEIRHAKKYTQELHSTLELVTMIAANADSVQEYAYNFAMGDPEETTRIINILTPILIEQK